jgi:hypothetical protein
MIKEFDVRIPDGYDLKKIVEQLLSELLTFGRLAAVKRITDVGKP